MRRSNASLATDYTERDGLDYKVKCMFLCH